MIDYSRNWALNQDMIRNGNVTVVGCGALASYLCFYMAGLGLRKVRIIDDSIGYESEEFLLRESNNFKVLSLENKVKEINNDMVIEAVPLPPEDYFLGSPDVLLDVSNSSKTKELCAEYFYRNSRIKLFVSASSSPTSSSAIFRREKSKAARIIQNSTMPEFDSIKQGGFPSGIMAAVILDEIRKTVSPLEGDDNLTGRINYGLSSSKRFSDSEINVYSDKERQKSVLLCGAGGIGTYVALNLALEGISMDIYDGDIIESHNVARQLFYYGSNGKRKVDVLRSKLKEIAPDARINARSSYITENTLKWMPEYDAIICCADNWEARRILNNHALEREAQLVNAAVTSFGAVAESYIPGTNTCLECRYDFDRLSGMKPAGCAELHESNVIMTNALIGALIAGEIVSKQSMLSKRFEYSSKNGNKRKFNIIENKSRGKTKCRCQE